MRIGIAGISGRMGRLLVAQVAAAGATLAGGIGSGRAGTAPDVLPGLLPDIAALAAASDVVIDFTNAAAVAAHAAALAAAGTGWVLGTSGLSAEDEAAVARASARIPVVYAANFAPGASLVLALAERMAAALPAADYDAEIVEMHHRQKVDAPSGTAIALGRAVAAGRGVRFEDAAERGRDGHTGPRAPGAIGFAALRGGQVVGEHTLLFAGAAEHIALTHRAFDRSSFAAGAVRAARWLADPPAGHPAGLRAPGLFGMPDVLGLA